MKPNQWMILVVLGLAQAGVSSAEDQEGALAWNQSEEGTQPADPQGFQDASDSRRLEGALSDDLNERDSDSQSISSKKKKKRIPRERDAEGTQAPNRFENEMIIKSRYELNGQPLEVDTD